MRTFRCQCGATLIFENYRCLTCDRTLGFLPDRLQLAGMEPAGDGHWQTPGVPHRYHQCRNYSELQVCNWMVREDEHAYCIACRLNETIPNLSEPGNTLLWYRMECAKRRLIYTLLLLGLPIDGRGQGEPAGLGFRFLQDPDRLPMADELGNYERVMTGHAQGLITVNLAEADPSAREQMREQMNESYRTLLGLFRHESGHYYWERLIKGTAWLEEFRSLFGDEGANYDAALRGYYATGPHANWQQEFVSAYASSHPWEDWAETWAHYLHMVDTLETAKDQGFVIQGAPVEAPAHQAGQPLAVLNEEDFAGLCEHWDRLTLAMNSLNRSMGQPDAYPFTVSARASEKLHFVHRLVAALAAH